MAPQRSDASLIADVLGGNLETFTQLVRRYRDGHMRFAVRMLGSRFDADEALQTAWLRAFRHLHCCTDPTRFAGWVFAIVANECRTMASRRARRERRLVDDEALLEMASVDDGSASRAEREQIERALDELSPEQREAFILKHVEEMSYEEMADVTGAGVSALKMRVKRACERLRELLEEVEDVRA